MTSAQTLGALIELVPEDRQAASQYYWLARWRRPS